MMGKIFFYFVKTASPSLGKNFEMEKMFFYFGKTGRPSLGKTSRLEKSFSIQAKLPDGLPGPRLLYVSQRLIYFPFTNIGFYHIGFFHKIIIVVFFCFTNIVFVSSQGRIFLYFIFFIWTVIFIIFFIFH